jgi:hypothetical protein
MPGCPPHSIRVLLLACACALVTHGTAHADVLLSTAACGASTSDIAYVSPSGVSNGSCSVTFGSNTDVAYLSMYQIDLAGTAMPPFADYSFGATDWDQGVDMFGVCLATAGAGVVPTWTKDANGDCAAVDTDPWRGVGAANDAAAQVASTTGAGVTAGGVSFRFGLRTTGTPAVGVYTAPVAMEAVAPSVPAVPVNTSLPTISGTTTQGQVLTSTTGAWSNSPTSYGYQWRRCDAAGANCVDVAGATASTYTLVVADVGATMRVVVTATNAGGSTPATSAQTVVIAGTGVPVNTALPVVSGTTVAGSTLTTANGTWTNTPTSYSYNWDRCDASGANCWATAGTSSTYVLTAADINFTIRSRVTATNASGSAFASSAVVGPVTATAPMFVREIGCTNAKAAGTTLVVTSFSRTAVGNLVVAQFTMLTAAGAISVSDSRSNTWVIDEDLVNGVRTVVAHTQVTTEIGSGDTITITHPSSTPRAFCVEEFGAAAGVDDAVSASGSSTTPSASATSTVAADLLVGSVGSNGPSGDTFTQDPAYTSTTRTGTTGGGATSNVTLAGGWRVAGAAGAYAYAPALGTARAWVDAIAAFRYDNGAPINTGAPSISGLPTELQLLTAATGTWQRSPSSYAFQWLRCDFAGANCVAIAGATASTYSLVAADIGGTIRVSVTATNAAGTSAAVSSAQTAVISGRPPANSIAPTFTGTVGQGWTLTKTGDGTWSGTATITYAQQWVRCTDNTTTASCAAIAGATATSYVQTIADVGSYLRLRVTATNVCAAGCGSVDAYSLPTTQVTGAPVNTALPVITGITQPGNTLSTTTGTWTGSPTGYTYQWIKCDDTGFTCENIVGATASTYVLTVDEADFRIRVAVTATNAIGSTAATSAVTSMVTVNAPATTGNIGCTSNKVASTSLTVVVAKTIPAKNSLLLRFAMANVAGAVTVSDTNFGTWVTRVDSVTAGVRTVIATTKVRSPLNSADTITVSFPSDANGKVVCVDGFTGVAQLDVSNAAVGSSTAPTVSGTTSSSPAFIFGGVGTNGPSGDTFTQAGGWSNLARSGTTGGSATTNATVAGGWKSNTPGVQTYAPTLGTSRAWVDGIVGLSYDVGQPFASAVPVVTGTTTQGQVLTTTTGTWIGSPTGYAYQWLRCDASGNSCVTIAGATATTYTLVLADVGSTIRSSVTATNASGSTTEQSLQTAVIAGSGTPPANTALPVISGTTTVGQLLTTTNGTWNNSPTGYTYQWRRCDAAGASCVDIAGATAATYTLVAGDAGGTIRVVVTAANAFGSTPATSAQTAVIAAGGAAPVNTTLPTIVGDMFVAQTLTAFNGAWSNVPTSYTYQWRRCDAVGATCVDIVGAASGTYTLVSGDSGSTIRVVVTATNASGSAAATSAQTPVIAATLSSNWVRTLASGSVKASSTTSYAFTVPAGGVPTGDLLVLTVGTTIGDPASNLTDGRNDTWIDDYWGSFSGNAILTAYVYVVAPLMPGDTITFPLQNGTASITSAVTIDQYTGMTFGSRDQRALFSVATTTTPSTSTVSITNNRELIHGMFSVLGPTSDVFTAGASYVARSKVGTTGGSAASNVTTYTESRTISATGSYVADGALSTSRSVASAFMSFPTNAASGFPVNSVAPAISGSAMNGSTLTVGSGTWSGTPTSYVYRWLQCDSDGADCVNIAGATSSTYAPTDSAIGGRIRAVVFAKNASGSAAVMTVPTAVVVQAPPIAGTPVLLGSAGVGEVLRVEPGTWLNGPPTLTYQWQKCDGAGASCVDIGGATGVTYTVQAGDIGSTFRSGITGTNVVGSTGPVYSAVSAVAVAAVTPRVVRPIGSSSTKVITVGSAIPAGSTIVVSTLGTGSWDPLISDSRGNFYQVDRFYGFSRAYVLFPLQVGDTITAAGTFNSMIANEITGISAVQACSSCKSSWWAGADPANMDLETRVTTTTAPTFLFAAHDSYYSPLTVLYDSEWTAGASMNSTYVMQTVGRTASTIGTFDDHARLTSPGIARESEMVSLDFESGSAPVVSSVPTVSGTVQDDEVLTAAGGAFAGASTTQYRWLVCDSTGNLCHPARDVGGSFITGAQLVVPHEAVGGTIRSVLVGTSAGGMQVAAKSLPTAIVAAPPGCTDPCVYRVAGIGTNKGGQPWNLSITQPVAADHRLVIVSAQIGGPSTYMVTNGTIQVGASPWSSMYLPGSTLSMQGIPMAVIALDIVDTNLNDAQSNTGGTASSMGTGTSFSVTPDTAASAAPNLALAAVAYNGPPSAATFTAGAGFTGYCAGPCASVGTTGGSASTNVTVYAMWARQTSTSLWTATGTLGTSQPWVGVAGGIW